MRDTPSIDHLGPSAERASAAHADAGVARARGLHRSRGHPEDSAPCGEHIDAVAILHSDVVKLTCVYIDTTLENTS